MLTIQNPMLYLPTSLKEVLRNEGRFDGRMPKVADLSSERKAGPRQMR